MYLDPHNVFMTSLLPSRAIFISQMSTSPIVGLLDTSGVKFILDYFKFGWGAKAFIGVIVLTP
jgi:hypothetical protein